VALARALASHPQVLLLDEPFSALDARVRDELREWLRSLHEQLHVTSVFVTHDQTEAMELADRIVIMRDGRLVQDGTPEEIVTQPNSAFVLNFLGRANALQGQAEHGVANIYGLHVPYPSANGVAVPVVGYFRPQRVTLQRESAGEALPVRVQKLLTAGLTVKVHLEIAGTAASFVAEIDLAQKDALGIAPGIDLYARPDEMRVFSSPEAPVAPADAED
jgi:sulfate transport system ATP-binding protein